MSYSSLWGIDKDFYGKCIEEYRNSWLFSIIIWYVLTEKYMGVEFSLLYANEQLNKLNGYLNASENISDRICWELSQQQIFLNKDKDLVADSIRKFIIDNSKYDIDPEDHISSLNREHIQERFNTIADDIRKCQYDYFVIKNTSVDDAVERWFYDYEKECPVPLHGTGNQFVIITDGVITDFIYPEEFMEGK